MQFVLSTPVVLWAAWLFFVRGWSSLLTRHLNKAGGPRYLHRFAAERTVSADTTAAGGNATLLSLAQET